MGQSRYYDSGQCTRIIIIMTVLGRKSVAILWILFRVNHIRAAECDLEKIFRTPKDMSKANFDHFEIVERNGFDRSEPATTTERPLAPVPAEAGRNVAKAQVLLRFGADEGHGTDHIMKIPPQCRHLIGNRPNFYYPPPPSKYQHACRAHYYHPYPPPVPYVFPNYYFLDNGEEPQYLPNQLREYFLRHEEFLDDSPRPVYREKVFIRGRPMTREDVGDYAARADVKGPAEKLITRPSVAAPETPVAYPEVVLLRPRVLKPLNLSNEDIEELIDEKAEDYVEPPKEAVKNAAANDIADYSEEKPRKHKKKSKKPKTDAKDLEKLLNNALVAYSCQNCSGPPKMLVSYPITNRAEDALEPAPECPDCGAMKTAKFANDIDQLGSLNTDDIRDGCKCENCRCNQRNNDMLPGRRFANDVDDLIIVVAEIIDPVGELRESYPEYVPKQIADEEYSNPSKSLLYRATTQQAASSISNQIGSNPPKVSHSEYSMSTGSGCRSDPFATVFYRAPIEVTGMALEGTLPPQNLVEAPQDFGVSPVGAPTYYFFPTPDVSVERRRPDPPLPKYLKVIPRNDLEFVPRREAAVGQRIIDHQPRCQKCGRVHSGGNFCDNCGFPVVFYPPADYCPRCPKETRQLNDW